MSEEEMGEGFLLFRENTNIAVITGIRYANRQPGTNPHKLLLPLRSRCKCKCAREKEEIISLANGKERHRERHRHEQNGANFSLS